MDKKLPPGWLGMLPSNGEPADSEDPAEIGNQTNSDLLSSVNPEWRTTPHAAELLEYLDNFSEFTTSLESDDPDGTVRTVFGILLPDIYVPATAKTDFATGWFSRNDTEATNNAGSFGMLGYFMKSMELLGEMFRKIDSTAIFSSNNLAKTKLAILPRLERPLEQEDINLLHSRYIHRITGLPGYSDVLTATRIWAEAWGELAYSQFKDDEDPSDSEISVNCERQEDILRRVLQDHGVQDIRFYDGVLTFAGGSVELSK